MAGKYSKLLFDSSKIPEWINIWCEHNLEGNFNIECTDSKQRIAYVINNAGKEIKIDFIKANGGALTIFPGVGKNQDISELIAEDIFGRISSDIDKSLYANGFSMKMSEEDFHILIDLLGEYDDITNESHSIQSEPGKPKYELYRFKSALNDAVVIKYYNNTNRIQIQGKPLYLFNEITSLICEDEHNAESVVDAHIELCNLNVSRSELDEELCAILGEDAYNYMTISHRAMLNSSIVLSKVRINGLDDYSYIIQQALRTYEGFTLKMMDEKGCVLPPRKQIGEFFTRATAEDSFTMKTKYTDTLDKKYIDIFEKMYNFYHDKRHPHMHSSAFDATTTLVGSYDVALEKLNEIIHDIKVSYSHFLV